MTTPSLCTVTLKTVANYRHAAERTLRHGHQNAAFHGGTNHDGEFLQQRIAQLGLLLEVERPQRVVEDQHVGALDDGAGKAQLLPLGE